MVDYSKQEGKLYSRRDINRGVLGILAGGLTGLLGSGCTSESRVQGFQRINPSLNRELVRQAIVTPAPYIPYSYDLAEELIESLSVPDRRKFDSLVEQDQTYIGVIVQVPNSGL